MIVCLSWAISFVYIDHFARFGGEALSLRANDWIYWVSGFLGLPVSHGRESEFHSRISLMNFQKKDNPIMTRTGWTGTIA